MRLPENQIYCFQVAFCLYGQYCIFEKLFMLKPLKYLFAWIVNNLNLLSGVATVGCKPSGLSSRRAQRPTCLSQIFSPLSAHGLKFFGYMVAMLCSLMLVACGDDGRQQQQFSGKTMGTTYTVKYLTDANSQLPPPEQVQAELDHLLQEVNRQMSTYQDDSEISRFNRMPAGEMVISTDFATVVAEAISLHELTEGALDVTVGPLVNLWGFGPNKSVIRSPNAEELAAAEAVVGINKIHLNRHDNRTQLGKLADGVSVDLSAIAKGFAVDKLAEHLDGLGIEHYLVEIGGELRARGHNQQNQPWSVGIEEPQLLQHQSTRVVVALQNQALATSGDYRNFHSDAEGRRLSHIINPQTGIPISHNLASVSVVADNTMRADGLATGLFVLGEERSMALAEQHGLAIFLIVKTPEGFSSRMSPAFEKLLASGNH